MPLPTHSVRSALGSLVLALVPLLTACSSDDEVVLFCPEAFRVGDASHLVKFVGAGRDLTDVRYEVELQGVGLACEYDDDVVENVLQVALLATRGPADQERLAPVKYFVAITTLDQRIVAREEFELTIPFEGNRTRVAVAEELEPRIPLKPGESGADYQIYVGLSLSREELRYNQENR
jgi:hypothetical protein